MNDKISTTDITTELRTLLGVFMAEVMRYDAAATLHILQREDMSMPRIATLNFVERRGAASISEISAYLNLSLGNTSTLVDKLVCQGFVTRVEDEKDRRHKVIRLTEKGQALVQELRAMRVEGVVQRMLHLPPELLDRVIEVLHDVKAQLPPTSATRRTAQL